MLTETLDLQHTLTELVELAVPRLADWCTIDMLERGEIRNVGVAHSDPETARLARRVHERRPLRAQASSGVSAALSTGRSQLIRDVPAWLAEQADARRGVADALPRARRALVDRRAARGPRTGVRRPHAGHRRSRAGTSRSRIWRSPRTSRGARRSPSRTPGSTAPSTTSPTRSSRASCPGTLTQPPGRRDRCALPPGRRGRRGRRRLLRHLADTTSIYFLAIGDVAGHGPAAAALTSLTRQAMRVVSRYEPSPGRILAVVNDTIRAQTAPEQFCTAALATLCPDRGRLPAHRRLRRPPTARDRPSRERARRRRSASAAPCSG